MAREPVVAGGGARALLVVQGATLFRWLSLRANLEWGPRALGTPQAGAIVDELLEATGLSGAADQLPRQLSWGMRQRAAIAQVLANQLTLELPSPRGRSTLADPRFVQRKAEVLGRVLDA